MIGENDLEAIRAKWLVFCGPCDAGVPSGCRCPEGDVRPTVSALCDEVEALRLECGTGGAR